MESDESGVAVGLWDTEGQAAVMVTQDVEAAWIPWGNLARAEESLEFWGGRWADPTVDWTELAPARPAALGASSWG